MRFLVLGPLEVTGEDGPIGLGGPKQRAVLAHLLVRANQVVPAETMIDHLWGDEPPESARNTVQTYISHLRKALGAERIEGRTPGYVLHVEPDELDAARFEALVREARAADGQPDRVRDLLGEALRLWRGPAFADLVADGLAGEIARLDELRIQATEERVSADLESGLHVEVVGELESLTREFPLRERLWSLLMLALYRSGRQADALAAFQRARETLADELGVDPSPELQRLHERILRQDDDLEVKGEPLRGYRLLEKIGEGAFGAVYRAIQPHVGREVAVKSIHPDLANQPDFVRRFEREAQLVALLEHPHVVPLYDYWREPDAAYLIMRFLRGGTLDDLVEAGPLDVERSARLLDQIGAALGAAHRQGIVHRDVKPGNILLDEEGNAYLSDFGVALGAGSVEQTTGTMIRGTPAYLSPEQIRLEPLTPRSDIYSFGIVLYEMLTGEHPFEGTSLRGLLDQHLEQSLPSVRRIRPELAPAVDAVIARATAKDPDARYADAEELATAFRAAAEGTSHAVAVSGEVRNPYKGLRAFLEADAADFFGRETLVRRLVERMAERSAGSRFLCVVGPSGSGKSSVVRAGLVPALRRGAIPGSERWFVIELIPGAHPMRQLESALLGIAVDPPPSLLEDLERDELGLIRAVERVLPDPDADLLIVLDQLEEVFTLVDDDAERSRLLDGLQAAAEAPGSRIRVVATLRADFFDQPLSVRGFGDLLADRTEAITPMSPEQLERAIAGPAEHVGLQVEPGLLAAMVTEVVDRPGALPLLQYALTELAEGADGGTLALEDYRRIGGVSGALARRAEQLFEQSDETARESCRLLFLRLVALGEGTEDTRRRVRRSELQSLAGSLSEARAMDGVIETFGRHRLLSFDRDPGSREPTVEIAHEALLREWGRFRGWIDEARESLRLTARVAAATAEWTQADRTDDYLLSGMRLAQAEEVLQDESIRLTEDEREYVDASLVRRDAEVESERTRHERELQLERRSKTRLRSLVAVLAVATLLAASLTVISVNRSREAERQQAESTIAGLTGESLSSLNTDPELSVLLALHAISLSDSLDTPIPAESAQALHWAMQEAGIEYPVADGSTAIAAGPLGVRGVFDLPLSDLAEAARGGVTRALTPTECERFLGTSTCPSLPAVFRADLPIEPVDPIPTDAGQPLFGTQVTLFGGNSPEEFAALREEFAGFTQDTGIEVRLVGNPAFDDYVVQSLQAGDPPDIGIVGQPGLVRDLAREGHLIDLGSYMDIERLKDDQSPYLVSLGTVGDDGSWPASDGAMYGAFVQLNLKSMIWYPVPELRAEGYTIPQTWDELISLSDQLVRDGRTPWCLGWESDAVSGWPGTDWIENTLLMEHGPAVYDQWTSHELPFDSPPVRQAFQRVGQILFTDGYVTDGAVQSPWWDAQDPMVNRRDPGCWLYQFPSFAVNELPQGAVGEITDVFPFPSLGGEPGAVMGGGNMLTVFSDRPEVREVVRYILGSHFGATLAGSTPFIASNRRFDVANYEPFERRQSRLINAALAADTFRFDGSDLMPPPIGDGLFWDAMMRYATEGPDSLDAILGELDAAWPAAEGPTTSPTPTAGPSPSPEPYFRTVQRALSEDEDRLLGYIPQDFAAGCLPLDSSEPVQGELAALVCRPAGVEVMYRLFAEPSSMETSFQANATLSRAPPGECATDHLAISTYTVGGQPAGQVLCYTAQPSNTRPASSHIEWTDETNAIQAHAVRNDLSDLALYEWWRSSAGPVIGDIVAKDLPASVGPPLRDGSYLASIPAEPDLRGVALRVNGSALVTYRIHIEEGTYELGLDGETVDAGAILLPKPNVVVFDPQAGKCAGTGPSGRPAAYEWSSTDRSLTWTDGGRCAGPQAVPERSAWTRAPEGMIAFATEGQIALMDAAGFDVEPLTADAGTQSNASPAWSADGDRIVFAGATQDGFDLYSMNADGTGVTRLTDQAGDELHPAVSPDGSTIMFVHESTLAGASRGSVVVIDPDGVGWTELANRENERLGWPAWSPDGRRIAFVGLKGDRFSIYVMTAEGGDLTTVRRQPQHVSGNDVFGLALSWTPDGKRLVFGGPGAGRNYTLLSMRPDGSDVREFADWFPESRWISELVLDWSTDGRWIVTAGTGAWVDTSGTLILLMRSDGSEVYTIGEYVTEPTWRPSAG